MNQVENKKINSKINKEEKHLETRVDNIRFAIYPKLEEVEFEQFDEDYDEYLQNNIYIPLELFEKFIEIYQNWRYCECGDEITTEGADKCDTCLFMDRIHSKREPPKGEIILNKIRTFFNKIYFSICLWLYEHSRAIRDIGWLDNETDFVKRTKKGKKN
jgi:hypothetical protein